MPASRLVISDDFVMLNLNTETVRFIIDKARAFQMVGEDEADDSIEGPDPT